MPYTRKGMYFFITHVNKIKQPALFVVLSPVCDGCEHFNFVKGPTQVQFVTVRQDCDPFARTLNFPLGPTFHVGNAYGAKKYSFS